MPSNILSHSLFSDVWRCSAEISIAKEFANKFKSVEASKSSEMNVCDSSIFKTLNMNRM